MEDWTLDGAVVELIKEPWNHGSAPLSAIPTGLFGVVCNYLNHTADGTVTAKLNEQ